MKKNFILMFAVMLSGALFAQNTTEKVLILLAHPDIASSKANAAIDRKSVV